MSNKSSELELLEKLNVDVAVIKEKLPLLDKISDCLAKLKDNCRIRHETLERARQDRHEKHELRLAGLEAAQQVTHAIFETRHASSSRQKLLFWSAVVAVATSAQVVAIIVAHLLSRM
jgi:hypothetical protein